MLLVGHEHVMKIPESWMTWAMILLAIVLIYSAFFLEKKYKAHVVAFTMFP